MGDMKPARVLVHYHCECPDCGHYPATVFDLADILPDGRIDMNSAPHGEYDVRCSKCQQREQDQAKDEARTARQQKKWRDGVGGKLKGGNRWSVSTTPD